MSGSLERQDNCRTCKKVTSHTKIYNSNTIAEEWVCAKCSTPKRPGDFPIDEPPGGSTPSQYAIPEDAENLQDLIEHRNMNFAMGNMFKAIYRFGNCEHSDPLRDLNKIIWFANREIGRLEDGRNKNK